MVKFNKYDKVICTPYRDSKQIELIGFISKIGRGIMNKIQFIQIKGTKKNTYGDLIYFSIKIFKYDWDLIKILEKKS